MRSIGKPKVSCSRNATAPSRTGASGARTRAGARHAALRDGHAEGPQRLLEDPGPRVERARELRLLAAHDLHDAGALVDEVRVGALHHVDDDGRGLVQERLAPPEEAAVAYRAPQDPPKDVPAPLVRGQHPVRDEERDRPRVIGDDLVTEALGLERVRVVAQQLPHPGVDGREQVGVVVRRDLLEDAGKPLEAHPGVDTAERERLAVPVRLLVELHEHEVPDLEPARARLGVVRDALRALAELRAAVEMDLAAASARPGFGHPPEVLLVAPVHVPPARDAIRGQADLLAPDGPGLLVVAVDGRGQPLGRDAEILRQQLPGQVDRLALEVVAEAPVAEHLEEGVVAGRPPHLLEVVVLPGDSQDPLVVDRAPVRASLAAGQDVLELDHPRVREEERLVAGRDQARARHDLVPSLGEERHETAADLVRRKRDDPLVRVRHPANGTVSSPWCARYRRRRSQQAAGSDAMTTRGIGRPVRRWYPAYRSRLFRLTSAHSRS